MMQQEKEVMMQQEEKEKPEFISTKPYITSYLLAITPSEEWPADPAQELAAKMEIYFWDRIDEKMLKIEGSMMISKQGLESLREKFGKKIGRSY